MSEHLLGHSAPDFDAEYRERLLDEFARAALSSVIRDMMYHPPTADPEFFQRISLIGGTVYRIADSCMAERARRCAEKK